MVTNGLIWFVKFSGSGADSSLWLPLVIIVSQPRINAYSCIARYRDVRTGILEACGYETVKEGSDSAVIRKLVFPL